MVQFVGFLNTTGEVSFFCSTCITVEVLDSVTVDVVALNILLEISFFLFKEFSIYPSATADDFHPPCCFSVSKSAPDSTSREADDRRNEWPVYLSGFGNFKNFAISLGARPILFIPTT